ncbi:MAG TPA: ABC transporter ATP-binding protein [Thermodesulfobacteriaceae bacterium]|nr:ABC transporter ATP-binding protein [Thermodesulfobacteriaceae bacterium]
MSEKTVAELKNVSIYYKLYGRPEDRLKETLHPLRKKYHRKFFALRDISLEVKKHTVLGIIGRNGAGKSSLLKIIAGVLTPSSGRVLVNGKISALLELGAGLNPELSGIENIHFYGSVLGFSREEMSKKVDEIAAFADLGDFINQPLKTYSSGMKARLAFAVSVNVEPDILIVDEVMAVGDVPFQIKCFARMRKMIDRGVTVFFVSHAIDSIRNFCDKAVYLHQGRIVASGQCKSVCDLYQSDCRKAQGLLPSPERPSGNIPVRQVPRSEKDFRVRNTSFEKNAMLQREGAGSAVFMDFYLSDQSGAVVQQIEFDQQVMVNTLIRFEEDITCVLHVGLDIKSLQGVRVANYVDPHFDQENTYHKGQIIRLSFPASFPLAAGKYYISAGMFSFRPGGRFVDGTIDYSNAVLMDLVEYSYHFSVLVYNKLPLRGPVTFHVKYDLQI